MKKFFFPVVTFLLVILISRGQPVLAIDSSTATTETTTTNATQPAKIKNQVRLEEKMQDRLNKQLEIKEKAQNKIQERTQLLEQKREEFQQRFQELKDQRKKNIIEKLDQKYKHINTRWTTHFLNVLERLSKILDKIEQRLEIVGAKKTIDRTAIDQKIASSRTIIAETKTAVETQAAKEYTPDLSDEEKLGEEAQLLNQQLKDDLSALREKVKTTRQSVIDVFKLLGSTIGSGSNATESASSPSVTPNASPSANPI